MNNTVPTNSPRQATKWFLSARRFDSVAADRDGIPTPGPVAPVAVGFVFLGRGILDFKAPHQLHLLQGSFCFPSRFFASCAFSATAPPLEPLKPNSVLCAAPSLTVVVTPSPMPLSPPPPPRVLAPSPVNEVVAEPMSGGERFRLCEGMIGLWNGKTEDSLPCSSMAKMDCLKNLSAQSSQREQRIARRFRETRRVAGQSASLLKQAGSSCRTASSRSDKDPHEETVRYVTRVNCIACMDVYIGEDV